MRRRAVQVIELDVRMDDPFKKEYISGGTSFGI